MFNKQNITLVGVIIALILSTLGLVGGNNQPVELGASGTRFPNGISADTTSPSAGQVRGTTGLFTSLLTLNGGLTVTTTNAATSTSRFGCIQTTATSTATPIKLAFTGSFSATTTFPTGTDVDGATNGGLVAWVYGNCP